MAQPACFLRKNDENRLRDLFRLLGSHHVPQRNGINQVDIARYQPREGILGMLLAISPQQRAVIH